MKQRKRVTRHRKVRRLRAAADESNRRWGPNPERARLYRPSSYRTNKKRVTLNLDADVLAWFRKQGRGYQTTINRELWKFMMEERKRSGE